MNTEKVLSSLAEHGLLLKQDKRLPNVVTILTGESLATSWWSHPKGRLIFRVLSELADHSDVLITKLLLGKDTLVHRSLWPALLTIAGARRPWQVSDLSPTARALLLKANRQGAMVRSSGAPVRELISRLLVHSVEVHTESGKHEIAVESWSAWAARINITPSRSLAHALEVFDNTCMAIGAPLSALPWYSSKSLSRM